ncbi:MAG: hypothetical protein EU542_05700 [Promethearchaeota archaeon]|nr:MAG: hypothetical protein EU542_05700 [Candidatus Lokiarchaeota archaeon]
MYTKKKRIFIIVLLLTSLIVNYFSYQLRYNPISSNTREETEKKPSATASVLWNYTARSGVPTSAALADIDEDGKLEVMIGSADDYMYALNSEDGTLVWESNPGGHIYSSPTLGDIDNDGKLEVVFGSYGNHLYALNTENGSELWRFPTGDAVAGDAAIADLDGDNKLEVVFGSLDNKVYVLNGEDGSLLWNYTTGDDIYSSPAIGDLNDDGKLEVVIGSRDHKIYVFHGENGTILWSYESDYWNPNSPSIGDFDLDGDLDLVISFTYGTLVKVYSFQGHNGSVHWTYEKDFLGSADTALADIDGDGYLEIVFGDRLALNAESGSVYYERALQFASGTTAVLGDVDGDGKLEAICPDHSASYEVHAISFDTNTSEWSFYAGYYVLSVPVLEDIDGDGALEAIFGCQNYQIYAVDITPSGSEIGWQGDSGDNAFHRWRNKEYNPLQQNQPPVCDIDLLMDGEIVERVPVGLQFDINVEQSFDDGYIEQVRFGSDTSQDGMFSGTWSEWYDWEISSGNWDAASKVRTWIFGNGGYKEIWVELVDNNGSSSNAYENILAKYDLTRDARIQASSLEVDFYALDNLTLNFHIHRLTAASDLTSFTNAIEDFGIDASEMTIFQNWIFEIGNFYNFLEYLQSKMPYFITNYIKSLLEPYVSDDGYVRFSLTQMANLPEFTLKSFEELLEFLYKFYAHQNGLVVSESLYKLFKTTFDTFFNPSIFEGLIQLSLKPKYLDYQIEDLVINVFFEFAKAIEITTHTIDIENNVIQASLGYSLKERWETTEFFYKTLKLILKAIALFFVPGDELLIATILFASKALHYELTYFFDYELGQKGLLADIIYLTTDFIDPPVARLDLQIRDISNNQLLLGHDPLTNTTLNFHQFGFFTGDLESQLIFLNVSMLPVNVCIVNTHLDPGQPLIWLNQSTNIKLINSSMFSNVFSYIQSNHSVSTSLNFSESHGLIYNALRINFQEQGQNWALIEILDYDGQPVFDTSLKLFHNGQHVDSNLYNVASLGGNLYNITIDDALMNNELLIVAEKSNYLPNSYPLNLGIWNPYIDSNPSISFFLIPILMVILLSLAFLLIKIRIKVKTN